jgi:hypothetical protein
VAHTTVQRDLAAGGTHVPPDRTLGRDGKSYPAHTGRRHDAVAAI